MKVYGYPGSTCTRKVLMTLNEKNAPFKFEKIDLVKGEQKLPDYLKKHQPFGVVPVLDDDGYEMYESRAIIRYLDLRLPGVALTPKDAHLFGRMEQWISVEASYFSDPAIQLVKQLFWGPMQGVVTDNAIVEKAKSRVQRALDVIEDVLTDKPYLVGEQFTLADISWMPYIEYLFPAKMGQLITDRPAVNRWWTEVSQRPSWVKIINFK